LNDPTDPENWRWLCKAAADGNSAAQYTVAVRYRDGLPPVARNVGRAYRWFTAAVRNGLSAAAVARNDLQKSIPEADLKALRDDKKPLTEADCAENGG
jgi:TPR repeat protein